MKCKVMIDYLTFSSKNWEPSDVIRGVLGMDPALFEDPGFGLLGYGQALKFSDIFVLYQPRENEYFRIWAFVSPCRVMAAVCLRA